TATLDRESRPLGMEFDVFHCQPVEVSTSTVARAPSNQAEPVINHAGSETLDHHLSLMVLRESGQQPEITCHLCAPPKLSAKCSPVKILRTFFDIAHRA